MGRISLTKRKLSVVLAYFLIYFVWGPTYYFIGVALRDIPTFLLGALRFSVAGILLLAICVCRGEKVLYLQLIRRSAVSGIVLLFVEYGRHHVGPTLCKQQSGGYCRLVHSNLDHAA